MHRQKKRNKKERKLGIMKERVNARSMYEQVERERWIRERQKVERKEGKREGRKEGGKEGEGREVKRNKGGRNRRTK